MQKKDPSKIIQIDSIQESDRSNFIQQLLNENFRLRQIIDEVTNKLAIQQELMQELRDEIATLKGLKHKPKIPPSNLEGPGSGKLDWRNRIDFHDSSMKTILFSTWVKEWASPEVSALRYCFSQIAASSTQQKRFSEISRLARQVIRMTRKISKPGQPRGKKRRKKTSLKIHRKLEIQPANIPEGSQFKGYCRYTVQDIIMESHNTQYYLARWQLPDGSYLTGGLPKDVHGHYGSTLVSYILHQYHDCRVTEALLLNQLHTVGILISAGQLNNILIENKESYIQEVAEILPVAAQIEKQVQTDDTGGRHNGQNQYTTIIGNRWFSVFTTTDSKSRINFLKLLQNGKEEFVINADTLDYLSRVNVPAYLPGYVSFSLGETFLTLAEWEQFLERRNIVRDTEIRFVTEAALYASVIKGGIPRDLGVHSDDAGQFDTFVHSLCWVHEERHYRKLIMTTDESRSDLERVKSQIWVLYQSLKTYKDLPSKEFSEIIEKEFDDIFQQKTSSPTLNRQLKKTAEKKKELLRVLQRTNTPLHNNSSETCARAAKIKLKISGGTRSELGQKVRDTFLSLKQTCRKLEINFMAFLQDRVQGLYEIPRLATIIRELALASVTDPSLSSSSQAPL